MRIFLSTGEASGELLAADLLGAMRARGAVLDAEGIGDVRLENAGVRLWHRTRGWASLGPIDALRKIPRLLTIMWATTLLLVRRPPDLVVLEAMLDGGLAGFDLARTLAKEFPALHLIMVIRVDEHLSAKERAAQDRDDGWMPVDRFMEKPLSPDVLVYEVDHIVGAAH